MANLREIQWSRLISEGIAIVLSILLAFSIDAWWNDRQAKGAEREVLVALLADLEQRQNDIPQSKAFTDGILLSTRRLLDLSLNDSERRDPTEIDKLLADQWWYTSRETFTTGTLMSFIESGQLHSISDSNLRLSLSNLAFYFSRLGQFSGEDRDFVVNRELPYLSRHAFLPQVLEAATRIPGGDESTPYTYKLDSHQRIDHTTLLGQREFQNILTERIDYLESIRSLVPWNDMEELLVETIAALHKELDERN